MSSKVIRIGPDAKVEKCLSLMTKHHFRHLPVLEEDRLVGVLSIEDVRSVT
jgi:CBS domain-containing protein